MRLEGREIHRVGIIACLIAATGTLSDDPQSGDVAELLKNAVKRVSDGAIVSAQNKHSVLLGRGRHSVRQNAEVDSQPRIRQKK
jgi:hypothetical protein